MDAEFLAGLPWLALASAALVTLALHGVAPRRCVALALAQDAAFGPTLGAALDACARTFRTGDASESGAVGDAALALKRLACWACTGVVLSRLRRRERTRVRRKVSTGALDGSFLASDDDDDDDDEDVDDDDDDVVVSRARHRSPRAPTAGRFVFLKTQSRGASAALLASRVLLAATFVAACAARVSESALVSGKDTVTSDALLLVKLALAVPLAAGYEVETTSRAAAACVTLEAFFWLDLRDARRRAHVAADVACAGGLVLVRAMGGGRYAADARGASKKRE